ncbi:APC family permease, partial [bacterium]|nr:APC family permease [bacterium]
MSASPPKLSRRLGFFQGLGFALTLVVGSGILGLPGMSIAKFGPVVPLGAWLWTIFSMVPLIYVFVALGNRYPESDGILRYAEIVFGPRGRAIGTLFLFGTILLGVPFVGYVCAEYLKGLPGLRHLPVGLTAILIFWLVTWINLRGVKLSGWINHASMAVIAALVLAITLGHFPYFVEGIRLLPQVADVSFSDLSCCSLLLLWAFIGWEELSFGLEEFKEEPKLIFRVYWGSYFLVALVYFGLALTASGAAAQGEAVSGTGGLWALIPPQAMFAVTAGVFLIALANTNSNVFVYSRMAFAAARAGILPRQLQALS